jgi:epoxyqueuosine reductase QueG
MNHGLHLPQTAPPPLRTANARILGRHLTQDQMLSRLERTANVGVRMYICTYIQSWCPVNRSLNTEKNRGIQTYDKPEKK